MKLLASQRRGMCRTIQTRSAQRTWRAVVQHEGQDTMTNTTHPAPPMIRLKEFLESVAPQQWRAISDGFFVEARGAYRTTKAITLPILNLYCDHEKCGREMD